MEVDEALEQIAEIHAHLAKAEVFREFRAIPVALTGLLGFAAAAAQPFVIGAAQSPLPFVIYWLCVAGVVALIICGSMAYAYWRHPNRWAMQKTLTVFGQITPVCVAGILLTAGLALRSREIVALLPGAWAILGGLCIFASRPYLPRHIGYAALYYVCAGALVLAIADGEKALWPWTMGLTFGIGQLLTAAILYWNLERKSKA
ncbi:MAG: hypothetical protein NTX50_21220 [Candidatus Sumerlaeota bacterium]|nr:hypothetical protein [Candidatus Sumerlaeota bacterium]